MKRMARERSGRGRASARRPTMRRASSSARSSPSACVSRRRRLRQAERQRAATQARQPTPDASTSGRARRARRSRARSIRSPIALAPPRGAQDADSRRLSDQLSKTQELREQGRRARSRHRAAAARERSRAAGRRQSSKRADAAGPASSKAGQQGQQAQRQGPQQAQGGQGNPRRGRAAGQGSRQGARRVQRPAGRQRRRPERQRSAAAARGERADARGRAAGRRDAPREPRHAGPARKSWWRSFSAPGTEAFKQDFARWESLKKNLLVALEDVESKVSDELRTRENKERLNAGGHDGRVRAVSRRWSRSTTARSPRRGSRSKPQVQSAAASPRVASPRPVDPLSAALGLKLAATGTS